MFLGHFGAGFAAKRYARASLGTLFLAAQFIDLLWPVLLLLGIERAEVTTGVPPLLFTHYPYSHSLLLVLLWGALFAGIHYWRKRDRTTALVLGGLVVSHWVLDLLVHAPDLPLAPGAPRVGLGLWSYLPLEIALESAIFIAGIALYLRATDASDAIGRYGVWALALVLAAIHALNILGPPPPNIGMVAWAGNLQWLFVILAYWVDAHRHGAAKV